MAVVPMHKVRVIVHTDDADSLLSILQRAGAMEVTQRGEADTSAPEVAFPLAHLQPRVQHAVNFLDAYAPKQGLWSILREGTQVPLTEAQARKQLEDTDVVAAVVEEVEQVQVEFAEAAERVRLLKERAAALAVWTDLTIPLAQFTTLHTETVLVADTGRNVPIAERLSTTLAAADIPHALSPVSDDHCAVTYARDVSQERVTSCVEAAGGTILSIPEGTGTPAAELAATETELVTAEGELGRLHDLAEHTARTHQKTLKVAAAVYGWQRERFAAVAKGTATRHTVMLDGWLNGHKRAAVEGAIERQGLAAAIADEPIGSEEEPPVEIENHPLIRPFEAVTRLYGMPGYRDLDPTLFLAGFFFLFFGLSLTDVGYGLFLVAVSSAILFLFKVSAGVRLFAKLLLMTGVATVLVGLLFGGYLGFDPANFPPALQALQVFDPIADPLPVFYLALGLGVVQVMVGMVLKIYSEARQGRTLEGVLDQGPWLLMFCFGIAYLAATLGYLSFITPAEMVPLFYLGIALIIIGSGRNGRNIFEMVQKAAAGLYDAVGYFSDILSYSRLLALGLATTALAFAVNLIAEIVQDAVPYVGAVFALLVLAIGHLFTLAVNTLGAFIHSARLQFVEFFGKFIAGTGRPFSPLVRSDEYVTIVDE